jgi:predicted phage terminase large subunit-like protein
MSNRLNDLKADAIVIIMQRVHEDDVSGVILTEGLDYVHLMIPMLYDTGRQVSPQGEPVTTSIGWFDPRYEEDLNACDGVLAWPERFAPDTTERIKRDIGPFAWACQYQQEPAPRGGGIFKRNWWQVWDDAPPLFEFILASVDSAFTDREQNDPTGMTIWGVFIHEKKRRLMLIHAWRKHLEFSGPRQEMLPNESKEVFRQRTRSGWGLIEWISETCERFKVDTLLIEAKSSGLSAAQELRNRYGLQNWSTVACPVKGDKVARARAVQATFAQGGVYAPVRDWSEMVITEMAMFPNGKYKDLTDSTTQAIKWLRDQGLAPTDEEIAAAEIELATFKSKSGLKSIPYLSA